ncbi:MAG TPA: tRNA (adenosine(37)-N6)-threonylcarbamoyltransferase complex dimerization subunit type 1 TsaB [Planctomycetota bacterium]|nr:tRNA (adenosine(37)-N6)-threonylcarbamoyltransferase complex dimerization subunit type 1 TsaB [Planctomycetota bacterium]
MKVLGIETSGARGGVALLEAGQVRGTRLFEKGMVHGRDIAPSIRSLLDELRWPLEAIDLIACDIGPGSYTGLRVGLAAAKGLALALGRPLIGVASLDAMAEAARDRAKILVPAMDAKWEQIYSAVYIDGLRTTDYLAEKPDAFAARVPKDAFVLGDALDQYGGLFRDIVKAPRELWDPRPDLVALLGQRLHEQGTRHDAATLVPLYLRPTEAEIKFGRKA